MVRLNRRECYVRICSIYLDKNHIACNNASTINFHKLILVFHTIDLLCIMPLAIIYIVKEGFSKGTTSCKFNAHQDNKTSATKNTDSLSILIHLAFLPFLSNASFASLV